MVLASWIRRLLSFSIRIALLCAMVYTTGWLLTTLSDPGAASSALLAISTLLMASAVLSWNAPLLMGGFAIIVVVVISIWMKSPLVSVYVLGAVAVLLLDLMAVLSAYIGKVKFARLQHICMFIGIVFPPLVAIIWLVSGSRVVFWFGCMGSSAACSVNVLFNKSAPSIGLPGFLRSKSMNSSDFEKWKRAAAASNARVTRQSVGNR